MPSAAQNDVAQQREKRGRLEGGALTDEVMDSSRSVLGTNRNGAIRGLQQWYSPPEAAQLVAAVNGTAMSTLDPTAGDGALLAGVDRECRFGIEIDADQVAPGTYHAIHGDLQRAYPLLRALGARFPRIAANPPFGLDWRDPSGKPENSTVATWRICQGLLAEDGCGAFVAGRDRFRRAVLPRADAAGIYAIVECPDLFVGVELPCLIAFFTAPAMRQEGADGFLELTAERADLPAFAERIIEARTERCGYFPSSYDRYRYSLDSHIEAVSAELERERKAAKDSRPRFDLSLAGGAVRARPTPFAKTVLSTRGVLRGIERLDRQPVSYFGLNLKEWRQLQAAAEEGVLSIDPALSEAVAGATAEAERDICPLYEVRPQQRLAFLDDLDTIRCTKPDPERGFEAGERYPLRTSSDVRVRRYEKASTTRSGDIKVRRYEEEAKVLTIDIGGQHFDESAADVTYLVEHFELPDPADLRTRFPDQVAAAEEALDGLASKHDFTYKRFQRDDLARLLVKGRGILGWEQGLGKSLGGLSLIEASIQRGARRAALIICPQDLVAQWQEEARKFLGLELEHLRTPERAREIAHHLRDGGEGVWVTHFEALSLIGRKDDALPHRPVRIRTEEGLVTLDSSEHCPNCTVDYYHGWQQRSQFVCGACGYVHKSLVVKPAAHWLAHSFADGVIVVDEGTLVKGDGSLRSKAIRGLRARHRYLMSGTPISNYVNDVFWLLWWVMGNATARFPYDYSGGRAKFEADFCVVEHMMGTPEKGTQHRRERRKVLPQVTNVSRLWRLLSGAMVRRRKEGTGEPLAPRTLRTLAVPMGTAQQKLYEHWLSKSNFERFFAWKHPGHPLLEAGLVEKFAAGIGQLQKLEYATTLPQADPDRSWPGLEEHELTNWTPKNLKVVDLAIEHARAGDKVLVGSCLIETGRWITERLQERGIRAVHIVEERDGRAQTLGPRQRAKAIAEFRHGSAQVLCCGIPSIRLGHNLDTASVVIVDGLVFSYEMFDQFIARAHRLTSKRPVTVYVPLVQGSLDEKKWELLSQKAQAADLALDGQLVPEREEPVSLEKVLRDLQRAGIRPTGDEIDERDLKAAWEAAAPVASQTPAVTRWEPPAEPGGPVEQLALFAAA
jgi:SNF2-related domain